MLGGVQALEALGLALDGHFHILLPSLVRLLPAVNTTATPKDQKRRILNTMAKLLPRMRLAPYASAVIHPLMLTLRDSRDPDICGDALAAICSVAVAIGDALALFVPAISGVIAHVQSAGAGGALPLDRWARLVDALERGEVHCFVSFLLSVICSSATCSHAWLHVCGGCLHSEVGGL